MTERAGDASFVAHRHILKEQSRSKLGRDRRSHPWNCTHRWRIRRRRLHCRLHHGGDWSDPAGDEAHGWCPIYAVLKFDTRKDGAREVAA